MDQVVPESSANSGYPTQDYLLPDLDLELLEQKEQFELPNMCPISFQPLVHSGVLGSQKEQPNKTKAVPGRS